MGSGRLRDWRLETGSRTNWLLFRLRMLLQVSVEVLVGAYIQGFDDVLFWEKAVSQQKLMRTHLELQDADSLQRARLRLSHERVLNQLPNLIISLKLFGI